MFSVLGSHHLLTFHLRAVAVSSSTKDSYRWGLHSLLFRLMSVHVGSSYSWAMTVQGILLFVGIEIFVVAFITVGCLSSTN